MQTLQVDVGHLRYPIAIGAGLLTNRELLDAHLRGRDLLIVTNTTVARLYLGKLTDSLASKRVAECILPDGEQHKTLQTAGWVFDALVAKKMNRDAAVLALGGGVVGDIAGFAAACYQRGIGYVQVPTTLLAQVDSSVGGKTGVNHPGGKNLIGAFYQPLGVIADTDTLATLPDRELRAGLAEVIKYGCVWDPLLFDWLDHNMPKLLARDVDALTYAIARSCEIKATVVAKDEREQNLRAILNFGHTFGHAIEAATAYEVYLHGEAVALGMLIAANLSHRAGLIDSAIRDRIRDILVKAGLPTETPRVGAARMQELMQMDKKVLGGAIRLVLLEKLGRVIVTTDYPQTALDASLAEFRVSALAAYAALDEHSRGRRYPEPKPDYRSEYQRDRDRIVHSTAFRRLVYKTQVFVNHEGDLYRTRLTHSLEVAQIARTIARALKLNEVLSEAICLAHDLGHTPFGHAGQDALNECMMDFGGFEHNLQSLRVVDLLEEHYADFDGLNLSFECREGILKHCSYNNAIQLGELGERFVNRQQPGLEAQLANFADEIAYNNHDVEDGIRAGLITVEEMLVVPLFRQYHTEVQTKYPTLGEGRRQVYEILRRMINHLVTDLIDSSAARLEASGVRSIADVRVHPRPLIGFSESTRELNHELKTFLREHVYKHYKVRRMTAKARRVVRELFDAFFNDPGLMPDEHEATGSRLELVQGPAGRARAVADYIAGMTDRYAILEHRRLFDPGERT